MSAPDLSMYAAASKAMQVATRLWALEFLQSSPRVLASRTVSSSILAYVASTPVARKRNRVGYDIHDDREMDEAFRSAANHLPRLLDALDTSEQPQHVREYYFAYRSRNLVDAVRKNPLRFQRMLIADVLLNKELVRPAAKVPLQVRFGRQLARFSQEFDLSGRAADLLAIAQVELRTETQP